MPIAPVPELGSCPCAPCERAAVLAARSNHARRIVGRAMGVLVLLALFLGSCAAPLAAQPMPRSFAPLVRRVLPAVVNIAVTEIESSAGELGSLLPPELRGTPLGQQFLDHFGQAQQVIAQGSGYIVAASGVIVTNNHVIKNARRIIVSLSNGRTLAAHVLGVDPPTDIAVLKVDAGTPLPFVRFGNSAKVQVGDWVVAAGNPFGLGGTVTAGIVSARNREIGDGPFDRFLQIDAPINPGNSGGPLFNLDGRVIGMNTAIVAPSGGSVGIGFAIPSNSIRPIVEQLREGHAIRRGWLGVAIQTLPGSSDGVAITGVLAGGPAGDAGIEVGDVVLTINGERLTSASDLLRVIAALSPGTRATVVLERNGQRLTRRVRVGERPENDKG